MKPFRIVGEASINLLEKILKTKKYNTWTLHFQKTGWVYIIRFQFGRKNWNNVIKVFIPLDKTDSLSDQFEEMARKHFSENLW